ncbi:MAG TPA: helix-turn-helix domain-containing protein [Streptosporangiaceae bacterium]|jgi:AraC-like DNA-binding protein
MELRPGYREWAPPAALRPAVSCLWTSVVPDSEPTLVLPDGCTDIIWQQGSGVFVAGPDTGPAPAVLPPGTMLAGVRLRPGAGGPVLGLPLAELRDLRVDLAEVRPDLAGQLPGGDLPPGQALGRLIAITAGLAAASPPDPLVSHAARLLATSRERTDELATELGLSERQLRRRCLDAVGYGPKALHRILRFRRFVSRIDAAGPGADLALIAAEAGYADQPHLTRESVRLAGLPPAALTRARRG